MEEEEIAFSQAIFIINYLLCTSLPCDHELQGRDFIRVGSIPCQVNTGNWAKKWHQLRVFDKILNRWQKLWSGWRTKQTHGEVVTCKREFLEKFECIGCISSILELQKLEFLNRAHRHHLILALLFSDSTSILYLNWGNFQKKSWRRVHVK